MIPILTVMVPALMARLVLVPLVLVLLSFLLLQLQSLELLFALLQLRGQSLVLVLQLLHCIGHGWLGNDGYGGFPCTVLLWSGEARIRTISKRVETILSMTDCMTHEDADTHLWAHASDPHVLGHLLLGKKCRVNETKPESIDSGRKIFIEGLYQRVRT